MQISPKKKQRKVENEIIKERKHASVCGETKYLMKQDALVRMALMTAPSRFLRGLFFFLFVLVRFLLFTCLSAVSFCSRELQDRAAHKRLRGRLNDTSCGYGDAGPLYRVITPSDIATNSRKKAITTAKKATANIRHL